MNDEHRHIDRNYGYDRLAAGAAWLSANDIDEPGEDTGADLYEVRRLASLSRNYFHALISTVCIAVIGAVISFSSSLYNINLKYPGLTILGLFFLSGIWMMCIDTHLRIACKRIRHLQIRKLTKGTSRNVSLPIDSLIDITYMTVSQGMGVTPIVQLLGNQLFSLSREDAVTLSPLRRKFLHVLISRNELSVPKWQRTDYHNHRTGIQQELLPAIVYALGFIGDRTSIPVLERFADFTDDPELRQSALNSIEQIRERLKYGPEQMLRASRLPEQADTLLRATTGAQDANSDPDELLRANQTGEAGTSTQQASRYLSDETGKQEEMRLRNQP
jgi:hypothetical protein